jgi:hypothetical protein
MLRASLLHNMRVALARYKTPTRKLRTVGSWSIRASGGGAEEADTLSPISAADELV